MSRPDLPVRVSGRDYNLLDGGSASHLFGDEIREATPHIAFEDVRVERCWPVGRLEPAGFVLEWSFRCRGRRHAIYGQWGVRRKSRPNSNSTPESTGTPRGEDARIILSSDGMRGLCRECHDGNLILRSPDQDALLPQMAICLNGSQMVKRLGAFGLTPHEGEPGEILLRCKLGGYRPGRRATVRFHSAASAVMLSGKTFRDQRGKELIRRHLLVSEELRLRCGGRLRVPAPVGFDDQLNMALFVWMPGFRAERTRHGSDALIRAAIQTLGTVHGLPCEGWDVFGKDDELAVVRRWCRTIQLLLPEAQSEAQALLDKLVHASSAVGQSRAVTIHRDFYEKQIILSPDSVTLLDLDTLACGDPAVDLGNFISHLFLRELAHRGNMESLAGAVERLLEGYEYHRGRIDRQSLCFFVASSLFRLGAVHALRTTTARHREVLWGTASRILDRERFAAGDLTECAGRSARGRNSWKAGVL